MVLYARAVMRLRRELDELGLSCLMGINVATATHECPGTDTSCPRVWYCLSHAPVFLSPCIVLSTHSPSNDSCFPLCAPLCVGTEGHDPQRHPLSYHGFF